MARKSSPTSTEGFGFTYADKVGAIALLRLLSRTAITDKALGYVVKVQFGQRPAGWHFDDILLTLEGDGHSRNIGLSIKSAPHVSTKGIDPSLVDLIWEQLTDGGPFNESTDRLGLVQPSVGSTLQKEFDELYRWAHRQDDGQLPDWLQLGVANSTKRKIADSSNRGAGKDDAHRFFRALLVLPLDLDPPNDREAREAIQECLKVLANPSEPDAESLWTHLCQAAADARGSAGTYNLSSLIQRLGPHFVFREHHRVEQDIKALKNFSATRHLADIRDVIGDDLKLPTDQAVEALDHELSQGSALFFIGNSGAGKTVVLKHFVEQCPAGELRLYFRADLASVSPTDLESRLMLKHRFADCLSESMAATITLVIDQVDRLITEDQIANLVELISCTKHLRPRLRFVFGCQTAEAERVLRRLSAVIGRSEVRRYILPPEPDGLFRAVANRFPSLRNIVFRPELRHVLLTPKNLDLLVGRLGELGELTNGEVTTQKQFVDWFWAKYVSDGDAGIAASTAMREVAELQADRMSPHVPPSLLSDRGALTLLVRKELIAGDDQGITFRHDSYGDWARVRSIGSAESLTEFFAERGKNPLWLRALRLWSAILLETNGSEAWKQVFEQFSGEGAVSWLVRDALLDGLALAAGSYEYLIDLKDVFVASNGSLLNRFLARFLFATSSPNDALAHAFAAEDISSLTAYRAEFRIPHWYLWGPVIRFIAHSAEDCRKLAPKLTSEAILPWLEWVPGSNPINKKIAQLAVKIASDQLEAERDYRDETGYEFRVFRCLCLALRHVPEEAELLIRHAIGRIGDDPFPESQTKGGKRFVKMNSYFDVAGDYEVKGPWPDGPVAPPSERFREFVLMGGGLSELFSHSPAFAKEVILAASIREPYLYESQHMHFPMPGHELSIAEGKSFYPPFHNKGVFAHLFDVNASWALELILFLVDFAVDRLAEEAMEDRGIEAAFDLRIGTNVLRIMGDANSFGWHRAANGSPNVITSALMSLEKWLYDIIEKGEGDAILEELVAGLRSAPIVGLLITVGKKYNRLFQNQLRFLHFSEIVQRIDIELVVRNESHQMIAWTGKGEKEIEEARTWHGMPHRKQLLKAHAFLALSVPEGRQQAEEACSRWRELAKDAKQDERLSLSNLVALYTFDNYTFEEQGEEVVIQCNFPKAVQKEVDLHSARAARSFEPLSLAIRSRQLLNLGEATEQEVADLYERARKLESESRVRDSMIASEDAIVGVATVVYRLSNPADVALDEARGWAVKTVVGVTLDPPTSWEHDSDHSVSDNLWCHFAAQSLPSICATDPSSVAYREALARIVEDGHYKTTAFLAQAIFEVRSVNQILYDQVVSLLRYRAIESMRLQVAEHGRHFAEYNIASENWPDYQSLRMEFLNGTLPTERPALPSPISILHEAPRGRQHGTYKDRARPLIDNHRLHCFISHLPWQSLPDDESARKDVIQQWDDQFEQVRLVLTNGGEPGARGRPVQIYQSEYELFRAFGQLAASCSSGELMGSWGRSIIELLPCAEHHAEQFFHGVFTRLLMGEVPDANVVMRWLELVELAVGSVKPNVEDWRREYGRHDWEHWLVGNDHILRKFYWGRHHSGFVETHVAIYGSWVQRMCKSERDFRYMLALLELPACEAIRARACIWIDNTLSGSLPGNGGSDVNESLASFLSIAREQVAQVRQRDPNVLDSFLNLVAMLSVCSNKVAMQLFDDVATLN